MTRTQWTVLDAAHAALRTAVHGVADGQWAGPTPCASWTTAQVVQHAAGDQRAYAAILTGTGFPAEDPFAPSGNVDGSFTDLVESATAASSAAFAAVPAEAQRVSVPLPQGPLPATVAAGACALDAAIHAWDIAVATGSPSPLDDALAAELIPTARSIVEPLRGFAYAAALPAQDCDGAAEALLRYLGRNPRWSPAG